MRAAAVGTRYLERIQGLDRGPADGNGREGQGEDITWDQIDQIEQFRRAGDLWLRGRRTLEEFSTLLGLADLFPVEPIRDSARFHGWAFESAARPRPPKRLSLQDAVGRVAKPVTFVVSIRLGEPPSLADLRALRRMDPSLHFKLDPTASWHDELLAELASLACVDVVDMKGHYRNATVAMDPDPDLFRRVFERLPGAWIEDPRWPTTSSGCSTGTKNRITWDEPIHSVGDIEALPWPPHMLNLKPARFGSVRRLFDAYDYCAARGIGAYGGACSSKGLDVGSSGTWLRCSIPMVRTTSPRGVQPAAFGERSSALSAPAGATPDRLPLGELRRAPQCRERSPGA